MINMMSMLPILSSMAKKGGSFHYTKWPIGIGILDLAVPGMAIGAVLLVVLGVIGLIVAMNKGGGEEEVSEEEY